MLAHPKRIVITPGEPAGVGPDVTLRIAQRAWPVELIAVCDPDLLTTRAKELGLKIKLIPWDANAPATVHTQGTLNIIPVKLQTPAKSGQLNVDNAPYVIRCLEMATDLCLQKKTDALVTGPVHKSIINAAGIPFSGHTEFLAERCKAPQVLMLFVVNEFKVALVTIHIPLANVASAITITKLTDTITLLHDELKNRFNLHNPHILVCGLNPHAGENGLLGREEIEIIEPALKLLRANKMHLSGPLPADTVFTEKYIKNADAIVAMYHDQALPVVKYAGFNHAVNVTLGLPIIRTSVDHGTAIDIAGTPLADAGSMASAISLAIDFAMRR